MNKLAITEMLTQSAWECEQVISHLESSNFFKYEEILNKRIEKLDKAFCRSWLGYHSKVYYREFKTPVAGDVFDPNWGLKDRYFSERSPNWIQYEDNFIDDFIFLDIENDYMETIRKISKEVYDKFSVIYEKIKQIFDVIYKFDNADTISRLLKQLNEIKAYSSSHNFIEYIKPKGRLLTRDMTAASQGLTIPRYIKIKAQLYEIYNPYHAFISLLRNINSLLSYLELTNVLQRKEEHGDRIFIGHGGSNVWKEIKDFLHEKLGLSWDEFDRVSTAGLATVERISDMLSSAQFAFIIFTSEDEYADESLHARENVIHEAGLFQGKLGFRKAIILLEEACSEFSNIHGLQQIRFKRENVPAIFEEIRGVLKREGIIN